MAESPVASHLSPLQSPSRLQSKSPAPGSTTSATPHSLTNVQTIAQARAELETRLANIHNDLQLTQTIGLLFVKRQEDLKNCFEQLQQLDEQEKSNDEANRDQDQVEDDDGNESKGVAQPLPESLREQLVALEKDFQEGENGIVGLKRLIDAQLPADVSQMPNSELPTSRSGSVLGPSALPSTSALPAQVISKPRRHKVVMSSTPSTSDAAFPLQIQEELLNQVRYWTSQAEMKEKLNQEYDTKITEQERIIDALNKQRRLREESDERQKEDQWNLELQNQELRHQNAELQAQLTKANHENAKIQKTFVTATEQVEQLKDKEEKTASQLELVKSRFEQDMTTMRKHMASIQREKSDLLTKVEELNTTMVLQQQKLSKKATLDAIALAQELEQEELENTADKPVLIQSSARALTGEEAAAAAAAAAGAAASKLEPKSTSLARESSFAHQQSIISELQTKLSKEITEKEELITAKEELLVEKEELVKMLADREETIEAMRLEGVSAFEPEIMSKRSSLALLGGANGFRLPLEMGLVDEHDLGQDHHPRDLSTALSEDGDFGSGRNSPFPAGGGLFAELAQATSQSNVRPNVEYKDQEIMTEPIESWIHTVPGFSDLVKASAAESATATGTAAADTTATADTTAADTTAVDAVDAVAADTTAAGANAAGANAAGTTAADTTATDTADVPDAGITDITAPEATAPEATAPDATGVKATAAKATNAEATNAEATNAEATAAIIAAVTVAAAAGTVVATSEQPRLEQPIDEVTDVSDSTSVAADTAPIRGKPGTETKQIAALDGITGPTVPAVEVLDTATAPEATPTAKDGKSTEASTTTSEESGEPVVPRNKPSSSVAVDEERRHTCDLSQTLGGSHSTSAVPPVPEVPKGIAQERKPETDEEREFRVSFGSAFGGDPSATDTGRIRTIYMENGSIAQGQGLPQQLQQQEQDRQKNGVDVPSTTSHPSAAGVTAVATAAAAGAATAVAADKLEKQRGASASERGSSSTTAVALKDQNGEQAADLTQTSLEVAGGQKDQDAVVASTGARPAPTAPTAVVSVSSRTTYTYNKSSSQVMLPHLNSSTHYHHHHHHTITDSSGATVGRHVNYRSSSNGSISSMSTDYNPAGGHYGRSGTLNGRRLSTSSNYEVTPTDPTMIQLITQTMIGDYLWKFTRRRMANMMAEKRHRRYVWVHPYTKTMYWSMNNPGAEGSREQRAKSALILAVFQVTDDNSNGQNSELPNVSLLIQTNSRNLKLKAPTREKHELWFQSISYLLSRPTTPGADTPTDHQTWSEVQANSSNGNNMNHQNGSNYNNNNNSSSIGNHHGHSRNASLSSNNNNNSGVQLAGAPVNDAVSNLRQSEKANHSLRNKGSMTRLQGMFGRNSISKEKSSTATTTTTTTTNKTSPPNSIGSPRIGPSGLGSSGITTTSAAAAGGAGLGGERNGTTTNSLATGGSNVHHHGRGGSIVALSEVLQE
ncbi:hypothetical protein EDD11_002096 [Mortierella claussenii]|nr:hypothetical protein EDD11_002096 [Mortierella claussenii]